MATEKSYWWDVFVLAFFTLVLQILFVKQKKKARQLDNKAPTVGPANKEVRESAIAEQPWPRYPEKQSILSENWKKKKA